MVEEATAASHALKTESGDLDVLVARFKVSGSAALSAGNPVHAAQARIAAYARPVPRTASRPVPRSAGNAAVKVDAWEEFRARPVFPMGR